MNWHQQSAARRHWKLRDHKAHILTTESCGTSDTLCGAKARVYVDRKHVDNPANGVCSKCLKKYRKENV